MLKAPGLFFLISSIAFEGEQPLLTSAIATKKGARPKPATQCTPILLYSNLSPAYGALFLLSYKILGSSFS